MQLGVTGRRIEGGAKACRVGIVLLAVVTAASLSGCLKSNVLGGLNETYHAGFVPTPDSLEQIPVGASRDQVQIVLGTPSTTADFGGEVWYYISQTRTRKALYANQKIVDQRVLAIYFDKENNIARVANYGLKDGHIFDFITQTTPTSGKDQGFLEQVLTGAVGVGGSNPFGG